MFQIKLRPATIRLIFISTNLLLFATILSSSVIPFMKIPKKQYADYIFWQYKPTLHIFVALSVSIILMGFAGIVNYNKCWQISYSLFLLLLILVSSFCLFTLNRVTLHIQDIINAILENDKTNQEILEIAIELNCAADKTEPPYLYIQDEGGNAGCIRRINNDIGNLIEFSRPWIISTLIFCVLLFVINLLIGLFISDNEEYDNFKSDSKKDN